MQSLNTRRFLNDQRPLPSTYLNRINGYDTSIYSIPSLCVPLEQYYNQHG